MCTCRCRGWTRPSPQDLADAADGAGRLLHRERAVPHVSTKLLGTGDGCEPVAAVDLPVQPGPSAEREVARRLGVARGREQSHGSGSSRHPDYGAFGCIPSSCSTLNLGTD